MQRPWLRRAFCTAQARVPRLAATKWSRFHHMSRLTSRPVLLQLRNQQASNMAFATKTGPIGRCRRNPWKQLHDRSPAPWLSAAVLHPARVRGAAYPAADTRLRHLRARRSSWPSGCSVSISAMPARRRSRCSAWRSRSISASATTPPMTAGGRGASCGASWSTTSAISRAARLPWSKTRWSCGRC